MTTDQVLTAILMDDLDAIRKAIRTLRKREKYLVTFLRAERRREKLRSDEWQQAQRTNTELERLDLDEL